MKKIINGKMYNTETAEIVAEVNYDGQTSPTSWTYNIETLYITKKGNFFIFDDFGVNANPKLYALTKEKAALWLEKHEFIDEYEEYFGAEEA